VQKNGGRGLEKKPYPLAGQNYSVSCSKAAADSRFWPVVYFSQKVIAAQITTEIIWQNLNKKNFDKL
jgi:hypothetical protein